MQQDELLVMEKVYAFTNPQELLKRIDELLEEDMPVALGIMPVYTHREYPAMREFQEVLRYAQGRGCRILLHFPIVQKAEPTADEIWNIMEEQRTLYEEGGIYPRGILLSEEDAPYEAIAEELETDWEVFRLDSPGLEYYDRELKESFPILKTNRLPEQKIAYTAEEIPEDFDFQKGIVEKVSVSLEKQNKVLMVIVLIGIVTFLAMIFYARRRNRKEFLKDEKEEG